ncbi:3-oxoacyl-ACP reductase FabG [Rickettsia endosymbiont of Cardiosporidium cionae]|uniref:3-oxoacyl-ACP reductase FabG n=1 Tax=Rickettsia endosymbiont of Cardiosporidium cionae TaxID=2777155 RepID=UPI0018947D94|nr:3-oxoacyl-ACP reductase FabG [Rickettsia endosymbiont of Cardiosporidium cionae]KAF8818614.1 3-oxoacyl-ACP reductase FabG [Rickettsia endosymbiont of Cardiosporidium cionae]
MIKLDNYNILVTGASGTIGAAISRLMYELGASVYITGTNIEKLEKLCSELGDRCYIKPCDLKNEKACCELVNSIDHIDVIVCNAGITRDKLSIQMKNDDFTEVIEVNLKANFILNREAIKKMLKNRFGRIINISSVVAISGNIGQANYAASKAGLIGMSKSFAAEVANKSITVNTIAPGFIKSDMTDILSMSQKEQIFQKIPQKRFGEAQDVANLVAFLASPLSSYITGQTFHVNGGMLMV